MAALGSDVTLLPSLGRGPTQAVAQNGNSATWDVYTDMWGTLQSRDGQATDQLLAGPSVLKYQLLLSGTDIDSALSTAAGWRNPRMQNAAGEATYTVSSQRTWSLNQVSPISLRDTERLVDMETSSI